MIAKFHSVWSFQPCGRHLAHAGAGVSRTVRPPFQRAQRPIKFLTLNSLLFRRFVLGCFTSGRIDMFCQAFEQWHVGPERYSGTAQNYDVARDYCANELIGNIGAIWQEPHGPPSILRTPAPIPGRLRGSVIDVGPQSADRQFWRLFSQQGMRIVTFKRPQ